MPWYRLLYSLEVWPFLIAAEGEDSVDSFCEQLKWTKLERKEVVVEPSSMTEVLTRGRNCLLVKVLSCKYFNQKAFKTTMKRVWKPTKPLRFYEMGAGLIMAEFNDVSDKNKVTRDGSWNFDKCLILVKEFVREQQMKHICMKEALFWIWIHDLPLMARNKYVGRRVGAG